MTTNPANRDSRAGRAVPRPVWLLGFVSMFMDISSEMIHSLLPVFLVQVLGANATALGFLEGSAEATVNVVKLFSGALSDWMGKRKPLALLGYGIAALSKPLFSLAGSFALASTARIIDRAGKGIRGAPRDALIAESTPPQVRGASYGLRQSLDTAGAIAGPLAAVWLMLVFGGNFRQVFWVATIPAFVSVAVLAFFVHEPRSAKQDKKPAPLQWRELRTFSPWFWGATAIGAVFTMARFSEAFLVLRGKGLGLADDYVPLVLVVMNVVYAAVSYPAGRLSDRMDRRAMLTLGAAALIAADIVLALSSGITHFMAGISLWGLHMGLTQGLLAAMVADAVPAERHGSAFGLFDLISGVVLLIASALAGALWDRIGPAATFYAGAIFAAAGLIGVMMEMKLRPGARAALVD